jgi:NAD(P)-dependent dehydrogenase (short-subunit alcohol dehydrogenase family)
LASAVVDRYGVPTILVNCMGGGLYKAAIDVDVVEWDQIHETHLRGAFLTCQAFALPMRDAGYGKIVNLSSTWAFTVGSGRSVYASAKAGLSHLTAALALEWAPLGIRVNAVAPTTTRTPRIEQMFLDDPEREQYAVDRIPIGRLATPADVVGPVLFLASPMSDFVTGTTLLVDGGWVTAK